MFQALDKALLDAVSQQKTQMNDPDNLFCMSLVPKFKTLTEQQKDDVQIAILQIFRQIKNGNSGGHQTVLNQGTSTAAGTQAPPPIFNQGTPTRAGAATLLPIRNQATPNTSGTQSNFVNPYQQQYQPTYQQLSWTLVIWTCSY